MEKLYRFTWDYGRSGKVYSVFSCDEEKLARLIGKYVNFGEMLGKHSQVSGYIGDGDIDLLTDDQDFIKKAEEYNLIPLGPVPFSYLKEDDEDYEW